MRPRLPQISFPLTPPPGARFPADRLLAGGLYLAPPQGLHVTNYLDPSIHHFKPAGRRRNPPTEVVIHDTQSLSVKGTVKVLRDRRTSDGKAGFGVHLIVAPDGRVTQHNNLTTEVVFHGNQHNGASVGIETVNPYFPSKLKPGMPWKESISAKWAFRGRYVLPTPAQAESVAKLIGWLTSPAARGFAIPRTWVGLRNLRMGMSRVPGTDGPAPGIYAHTYYLDQKGEKHADGAWLVLYAWLRLEAGLAPALAYETAKKLGQTKTRWVELPGKRLPPVSPPFCLPPIFGEVTSQGGIEACIEPDPTAGRFYRITPVDKAGLLQLAGRVYGETDPQVRVRLARVINDHPYNRRFWRKDLAGPMFPGGRISFNPRFACDSGAQSQATGPAPRGNCFATIWIPPRPES